MGSTASARLSRRLRARLANEGGFTLPELLITMAILLIVVASLASVLVAATKSQVDANTRFQAQGQARAGLDQFPAVTLNTGPGGITAGTTSVPVHWTGAAVPDPVHTGDVILIDSEQMLVTNAPATNGSATLTVTRAYNGTTAATHANGAAVTKAVTGTSGTAATPAPCVYTSGTVSLSPGTYYGGLRIGSANSANCDGANCSNTGTTTAYNPAVSLNTGPGGITASTTSVPVKWTTGSDPIAVNDVIQIDSEQMKVTAITPVTSTTATLTVTRAQNGTTAATHANNAAVSKAVAASNVSATLSPGIYIMAGGGFRACGASNLSAPNVLIYNTQDPTSPSGNGALDQIELNTTGNVLLGPQADDAYEGLTIWQDSALALDTADDCNHKSNHSQSSQAQIDNYDIALESAASTGANGSLGSVSGSIYAPSNRADFVESLSGTANLAVLASCIMINGGNSTFAFNPSGLFGSNWVLGPQAG
ncbi:MAG: type IV pilus modification PilV family protein [Gaiellaceae bacterium]